MIEPSRDCPLCPRLVAHRAVQRATHPEWFNAPVPVSGSADAWLAIVGLAPGLTGANRTGRAFTGDESGVLLYETLAKFGLTDGAHDARSDAGVALSGVVIVNAVRCLPPQNRPTPDEINRCRPFLEAVLTELTTFRVIVALGRIAHDSTVRALGGTLGQMPFGHGAEHVLPNDLVLIDSYHCSRYNQNTRRLTPAMFDAVFARALDVRNQPARAASI